MNYQRLRVYSAPVPKMPPGLLELMEGLSKDVLRNNPTSIYEFCANHMEKLLQIRDNNPPKTVLSLEQKITKAQKIIRDRAKQRREKYDKNKIQQEIECILIQNADESPMYMQKNIVVIQENAISCKQVELVKTDDDEYVRALLTSNSINEQHDENRTDENDMNQTLDALKQEENSEEEMALCECNIISMNALENKIETEAHCELTVKILSKDEEMKNSNNEEANSRNVEVEIQNVDVNKVDSNTTSDTIQDSAFTINDNNIRTQGDLKAGEDEASLDHHHNHHFDSINPLTLDIDAEAVVEKIETKQIEPGAEILNENETINKNNCDDSKNSPGRNPEDNVLNNDGNNTNPMDLETAAITIQKVFRSFLFKCKTTSIDESTNVDINLFINDKSAKDDINISNINKERRGITRMDTVLQTVNEEKSLSLSTDDSSTLSSAATVIQAHIRGYLVRNKLHINKTSSTSLHDSDAVSGTSLEMDSDNQKGKTILNIHIVPERGQFISRDESLITSMDLSLDGSPRSLTNLHPHSYDINERRKQLKREDAVQSVSPPSNNSSSKQSEDIDSVKECLVRDTSADVPKTINSHQSLQTENNYGASSEIHTAVENEASEISPQRSSEKLNTDEMDVVTPYNEQHTSNDPGNKNLMHSSEFHEAVLPTQVSRTDTSVVREFHNVLAYFLLWT